VAPQYSLKCNYRKRSEEKKIVAGRPLLGKVS
jgi:hypothetical protein